MKPIGWTRMRVQLECRHCHTRTKMEWLPYISALESEIAMPCPGCGAVECVEDRRQHQAEVPLDRRGLSSTLAAP
jgi:hypothetical protein